MVVNRYEIDEIYEKYRLQKLKFTDLYLAEETSVPVREGALRGIMECQGAMNCCLEIQEILRNPNLGRKRDANRTETDPSETT